MSVLRNAAYNRLAVFGFANLEIMPFIASFDKISRRIHVKPTQFVMIMMKSQNFLKTNHTILNNGARQNK